MHHGQNITVVKCSWSGRLRHLTLHKSNTKLTLVKTFHLINFHTSNIDLITFWKIKYQSRMKCWTGQIQFETVWIGCYWIVIINALAQRVHNKKPSIYLIWTWDPSMTVTSETAVTAVADQGMISLLLWLDASRIMHPCEMCDMMKSSSSTN